MQVENTTQDQSRVRKIPLQMKSIRSDKSRRDLLSMILTRLSGTGPQSGLDIYRNELVAEARTLSERYQRASETGLVLDKSLSDARGNIRQLMPKLRKKIRRFWDSLEDYIEESGEGRAVYLSFGLPMSGRRPDERTANGWQLYAKAILEGLHLFQSEEAEGPSPALVAAIKRYRGEMIALQLRVANALANQKILQVQLKSLRRDTDIFLVKVRSLVRIESAGKGKAYERDNLRSLGFSFRGETTQTIPDDSASNDPLGSLVATE